MIAFNSEKIKKMIEKKIHHPYLERYIDQPLIDINKISFLLMIYDQVALKKQLKEQHIISILLVQIALDTHELVTNESASLSDDIERQLSVLAGDYYSALYYKTLADIDENTLVRTLANAIKSINEHKMTLYQYEIKDWNLLIDTLKAIESTLLTHVGKLYQISTVDLQYISKSLLVNRLKKEIEAIQSQSFSYVQQYIERNLITLKEPSIEKQLEQSITYYEDRLTLLKNESTFSFNDLASLLNDKKILSAVEEG